jgi:protein-disulfide isomerase
LRRFHSIFLIFLLSLAALLTAAQEKGASKKSSGAAPGSRVASPRGKAPAAPLTPEIQRRIETEIRSRYDVPLQISIALSPPKAGTMPGYDDLTVTFTGGSHSSTHMFLISKDRKTLAHLETIDISTDLMSKIDVKGRPVKGNPNAAVTVIVYDDFQCPFCARMHSNLFDNVFKDYADKVRVIYKDYPLVEIHPWALHAAVDANCLGDQNSDAYWDFADYVHGNQKKISGNTRAEAFANLDNAARDQAQKHKLDQDKLQACLQKQDEGAVRASMTEGDKLGVNSTPTTFINGEKFTQVIPEQELRAILNRDLAKPENQSPPGAKK